jgi:hypothetical protein
MMKKGYDEAGDCVPESRFRTLVMPGAYGPQVYAVAAQSPVNTSRALDLRLQEVGEEYRRLV